MRFYYTKHVEIRVKQRSILKRWIEETVKFPDKSIDSFEGRSVVRKSFGQKTLEVVYKKFRLKTLIITAYWLKEA